MPANINNKVSERAVWENSVTPDNDIVPTKQPQMMFCYKCNKLIPENSRFCPYCSTALYVECPKCGVEYSSQYPGCFQCGTNREAYYERQRQEWEWKQKKKEEEQNEKIMETDEYRSIYSLLEKSVNDFYNILRKKEWKYFYICCIIWAVVISGFVCGLVFDNYFITQSFLWLFLSSFIWMWPIRFIPDRSSYRRKVFNRLIDKNGFDDDMKNALIELLIDNSGHDYFTGFWETSIFTRYSIYIYKKTSSLI